MFAIWWLSKQNTKLSQDSTTEKNEMRIAFREREASIKTEYEARIDEMQADYKSQVTDLKTELKEVKNFLFKLYEGIDVTPTIKRAHLKLKERGENG